MHIFGANNIVDKHKTIIKFCLSTAEHFINIPDDYENPAQSCLAYLYSLSPGVKQDVSENVTGKASCNYSSIKRSCKYKRRRSPPPSCCSIYHSRQKTVKAEIKIMLISLTLWKKQLWREHWECWLINYRDCGAPALTKISAFCARLSWKYAGLS